MNLYFLKSKWTCLIIMAAMMPACSSPVDERKPTSQVVEIRGMQFVPDVVNAAKGDTIIFINQDILVHDVTEDDKAWRSDSMVTGKSFQLIASKSEGFYCSLHPTMKGQILVDNNP